MTLHILTDIYPPEIKPVREGWYLTRMDVIYQWMTLEWRDGCWWYFGSITTAEYEWCGIAFDPSAAVKPKNPVRGGRFDGVYGVFLPGATCE